MGVRQRWGAPAGGTWKVPGRVRRRIMRRWWPRPSAHPTCPEAGGPGRVAGTVRSEMHEVASLVGSGPTGAAVDAIAERFVQWLRGGRGDDARGRHRHALMLLDTAWRRPGWPLHEYRPRRNPGAFLALTADLAFDLRYGLGARASGGSGCLAHEVAAVRGFLRDRLARPWTHALEDARAVGWHRLAVEVEATVRRALAPTPCGAPHELDVGAEPSLAWVLACLGFPDGAVLADEHHPVAGDLRGELRRGLDGPWHAALADWPRRDLVGFLATWPADPLELLALPGVDEALQDLDFAVFYARVTDARPPGRRWRPPAPLAPGDDEARALFDAMAGRRADDPASRREQRLLRLGLSATFPTTFARLDAWLASADAPGSLRAGADWWAAVDAAAERIELARAAFLVRVDERLGRMP
jgi:hypothetical protein